MSYYDYQASQKISMEDYPFYSLIMAAIRQADSENLEKLKGAFPSVYEEFLQRYNAPLGLLENEKAEV